MSADTLDLTALTWCLGEIRQSLNRAEAALEGHLKSGQTESSALEDACRGLRQAQGALRFIQLDGVAVLIAQAEHLIANIGRGSQTLDEPLLTLISRTFGATIEYLEGAAQGSGDSPVALFPHYRDLMSAQGQERVEPADLFSMALPSPVLAFLSGPASPLAPDDAKGVRSRFESGLLGFLRNPSDAHALEAMQSTATRLRTAPAQTEHRAYWWLAGAFIDALRQGALAPDIYAKRQFARIQQQLRKTLSAEQDDSPVTERMLRELLFLLARAEDGSAPADEVRRLYRLNGMVPAQFEAPRYGRFDARRLREALDATAQAKAAWEKGVRDGLSALPAFAAAARQMDLALAHLPLPGMQRLSAAMANLRKAFEANQGAVTERVSLEVATGLLFVEQTLVLGAAVASQNDQKAGELADRIAALQSPSGEQSSMPDWLAALLRSTQDRLTLDAYVRELQVNLHECERALDAFFRDPQEHAGLGTVDHQLMQVSGALRLLGYQDASQGVDAVARRVGALIASSEPPAKAQCEQVAESLGALGFFVESLRRTDRGKVGFEFHADESGFVARLQAPAGEPEPDAPAALTEGVPFEALPFEVLPAAMAPVTPMVDLSFEGIEGIEELEEPLSLPAAFEVLDEAVELSEVSQPQPLVSSMVPTVDAELVGIFLDEADEVLEAIAAGLDALTVSPSDHESLGDIRRNFHTLKGSSRMVGLGGFGETAWSLEQTLNHWLSAGRDASPELIALAGDAYRLLSEWVGALRLDPLATVDASALMAAAEALSPVDDAEVSAIDTRPPAMPVEPQGAASDLSASLDLPELTLDLPASLDLPELTLDLPASLDLPDLTLDASLDPPDAETSPALSVEPLLPQLSSAMQPESLSASISESISLPESQPEAEPDADAQSQSQSQPQSGLAPEPAPGEPQAPVTADDDALIDLGELGLDVQPILKADDPIDPIDLDAPTVSAPAIPGQLPEPDEVRIGKRTLSASLYRIFLEEADQLLAVLSDAHSQWCDAAASIASSEVSRAAHSLSGSARIVGLQTVQAGARALESFLDAQAASGRELSPIDIEDLGVVLDQIRAALHRFAAGDEPGPDPLLRERSESLAERWKLTTPEVTTEALNADGSGIQATVKTSDAESLGPAAEDPAYPADEIDADLLPIFIEEAIELLPQIGERLREWGQRPGEASLPAALMRLLHTVKGSARMAGAMRLGQAVHEMEALIEAAGTAAPASAELLDDLVARHDQVLSLYESIRAPLAGGTVDTKAVPRTELPLREDTLPEADALTPSMPASADVSGGIPAPAGDAGAAQPLIRVRADLLDRLVNEAGEVSIARARLDNELTGVRQSLSELSENVSRLRAQLREIELAADTQIQARIIARDQESDAHFDPLEFDRYTRFQELTRLLAESVNDVATVHQNALRGLDDAGRDLARQSQVTRELQQDLMRIRMVRFGSVSDRLYRVVRQAAKELDKRVHLDLIGVDTEIDRGVLERMVGPLEHLLRNAVAHGVESRAVRLQSGKSETGEIRLEVRQDSKGVIMTIGDDGAGLDVSRIRARAIERGLVDAQTSMGDRELAQLIFMPGFTTITEVTTLAGRGVGLDVVRAEAAAMGGRIDLDFTPGRGTRFTLHLPVSLAVTQVVLLSVGQTRIAVASGLVEQVMQVRPEVLTAAYAQHSIDWQGEAIPLYFLGSLLELPDANPLAQRYSPVVLLRSGSQRIALHVDHVAPSQEVVVKHVGAQLARLTGMAGATVLGNGDIVLILDPVQIAATGRGKPAGQGDTASFAPMRIDIAPTVMVVDDSVTVRKITQRLLLREGYQVMLARDGLDALRQLQDSAPEVMLLDIEMPRMDGFELLSRLRDDDRWRAIPVIMISSRTADKHREHAAQLGVDAFLGKPYDETELLQRIRQLAFNRSPSA